MKPAHGVTSAKGATACPLGPSIAWRRPVALVRCNRTDRVRVYACGIGLLHHERCTSLLTPNDTDALTTTRAGGRARIAQAIGADGGGTCCSGGACQPVCCHPWCACHQYLSIRVYTRCPTVHATTQDEVLRDVTEQIRTAAKDMADAVSAIDAAVDAVTELATTTVEEAAPAAVPPPVAQVVETPPPAPVAPPPAPVVAPPAPVVAPPPAPVVAPKVRACCHTTSMLHPRQCFTHVPAADSGSQRPASRPGAQDAAARFHGQLVQRHARQRARK